MLQASESGIVVYNLRYESSLARPVITVIGHCEILLPNTKDRQNPRLCNQEQ